jgi:hypothetical protein
MFINRILYNENFLSYVLRALLSYNNLAIIISLSYSLLFSLIFHRMNWICFNEIRNINLRSYLPEELFLWILLFLPIFDFISYISKIIFFLIDFTLIFESWFSQVYFCFTLIYVKNSCSYVFLNFMIFKHFSINSFLKFVLLLRGSWSKLFQIYQILTLIFIFISFLRVFVFI